MPASFFRQQLDTQPDSLALTDLQARRSWRELDRNVSRIADFLRREGGARPGDHLALLIGNRVEYIEAMLAGLLAGLWVTPINSHLSPREIDYVRVDCGARILLHDSQHKGLLGAGETDVLINIETVMKDLPDSIGRAIEPEAPAGGNMLYTSGTTGKPKGVKRAKPATVGEMIERMRGLGLTFGLNGQGPHLVTGPLYHAAPGMFAIYDLLNGAPMVIMPKWDSGTFFNCVSEYRVATTHLVPTMFVRLLEVLDRGLRGVDLTSLQYVLHGAAPISRQVKERMLSWWGPILTEYWGATESGVVTLVDSHQWTSHPGTVGRPIANFEVFVGDDEGRPVAAPEGLLFCRHRQLARVFEYHNDEPKTRKAHPSPHIFSLGDIGRVDDQGLVYLSDRESHMIISGGVNIYPSEVEQALLEHPDVVDAAVFGMPNAEWGEEVKAVVQLRPGVPESLISEDGLREFVRSLIAGFKVPRSIDFIDELPRSPSGKVLIRQLREAYSA